MPCFSRNGRKTKKAFHYLKCPCRDNVDQRLIFTFPIALNDRKGCFLKRLHILDDRIAKF